MTSIQRLLICCFWASTTVLSAQNIHLWNGETGNDLLCQTNNYFEINNTEPYAGTNCLEAHFDNWNGAVLQLGDCSYYRENINFTQNLCFQIKANIPDQNIQMNIGAWHSSSNTVSPTIDITPFVVDGEVTDDYKLACIPLDAFRDGTFTALWLETIKFTVESPDPALRVHIDDLTLTDVLPSIPQQIEPIANNAIRVHYDSRYDALSASNPANYFITSTDDPLFANPVSPTFIGIHHFYDGLESDSLWLALSARTKIIIQYFERFSTPFFVRKPRRSPAMAAFSSLKEVETHLKL